MITMYNAISGIMVSRSASSAGCRAVVENQGVEWVFEVSRSCLQALPENGQPVRILCFLVVREDAQYLAGFRDEGERQLFLDLLKVEGIGAKQALKILSGMDARRIAGLLDAGDVDGLETIPGLGKKTAQKMVLALKGKLTLDSESAPSRRDAPHMGEYEDVAQALVQMGYDRKSVVTALEKLIPGLAGTDRHAREQELLGAAIRALG